MPKKYSPDFKERAIRMVEDHQRVHASSVWSAAEAVGQKLGISAHTVRGWMKQARKKLLSGDVSVPGEGRSAAQERIAQLEAENLELRRANEILKSASAFFAAELDRPTTR